MHRTFQRDLCKLRLASARAYVKIITDGSGPVSYSSKASVRLTAEVRGLGPLFKVVFTLKNTGTAPLLRVPVTFGFKASLYSVAIPFMIIPVLVPVRILSPLALFLLLSSPVSLSLTLARSLALFWLSLTEGLLYSLLSSPLH